MGWVDDVGGRQWSCGGPAEASAVSEKGDQAVHSGPWRDMVGPAALRVHPSLTLGCQPSSKWPPPAMSSACHADKEKVSGWGSSGGCRKITEMLILLVFLRESTKSTPDKKEAEERGRLFS